MGLLLPQKGLITAVASLAINLSIIERNISVAIQSVIMSSIQYISFPAKDIVPHLLSIISVKV